MSLTNEHGRVNTETPNLDSRMRKPTRVYVEKGPNFREGEGIYVWGSS